MPRMTSKFFKVWLATFLVMLIIDAVWLGVVARSLYQQEMGDLMASKPNWAAALAFYLAYPVGLVIFAVQPALHSGGARRAALLGGLFGFFAYGTYDMTNLAVVQGWPMALSLIDLAWGTAASAASAATATAVTRWWARR